MLGHAAVLLSTLAAAAAEAAGEMHPVEAIAAAEAAGEVHLGAQITDTDQAGAARASCAASSSESATSSTEPVGGAPSTDVAAPLTVHVGAATTSSASTSDVPLEVDEWRRERARHAGQEAQRKLLRITNRVAPTPQRNLFRGALRDLPHYVILRARAGLDVAGYFTEWSQAKVVVCSPPGFRVPANEAVFHRFESLEEAQEYWDAAWAPAHRALARLN